GVAATDGRNIINITGGFDNMVNQFIDFQGSRYAVGYFRSVNGQSVRYIARSVNGAWTPLTAPDGPTGGIVAATVLGDSLAVLWHERDAMGTTPRVSLWNGSTWQHWPALPRGRMSNGLAAFDGSLHTIVYERVNGIFTRSVVYRSSGQGWERMDVPTINSTNPTLNARATVAVIGGELVYQNTRGSFVRTGDRWVEQVARDTGKPVDIVDTAGGPALAVNTDGTYERSAQGWVLRAPGTTLLTRTASVNANGELIVAYISPFSSDDVTISSWNGATWVQRDVIASTTQRAIQQVLASTEEPWTATIAIDPATNGVLVGGPFLSAFNRHDFQVLLNLTPRIVFTEVPVPTRVQPGQTASLAVQVASTGDFTYQWLRDGVAIVDGTLATGEVISGATGPTLTITGATAAINGVYTCTVTPVTAGVYCSSETTAPVMLTAERFCDSIDINNNTVFPEDQDVIDFLSIVSGGECSPGNTCNDIDFNNDEVFPDDQDVIDFFNALAGGACP
ncbi:MAG TPA: immunoglobulin domain-containing protein, partial [Phycisphaerales bacterium]|nr:immunoglobulin domain-containing protein [Phycisphaerales bacterium]